MSGHSKWSNIKHKKEKTDAQKGKIFTKLGREITVAVKSGGADPEVNRKLKDIIAKARSNNMPNDNISRCIKKALGDGNEDSYENITYEGYGRRALRLSLKRSPTTETEPQAICAIILTNSAEISAQTAR